LSVALSSTPTREGQDAMKDEQWMVIARRDGVLEPIKIGPFESREDAEAVASQIAVQAFACLRSVRVVQCDHDAPAAGPTRVVAD
jgi:hypothetical protein